MVFLSSGNCGESINNKVAVGYGRYIKPRLILTAVNVVYSAVVYTVVIYRRVVVVSDSAVARFIRHHVFYRVLRRIAYACFVKGYGKGVANLHIRKFRSGYLEAVGAYILYRAICTRYLNCSGFACGNSAYRGKLAIAEPVSADAIFYLNRSVYLRLYPVGVSNGNYLVVRTHFVIIEKIYGKAAADICVVIVRVVRNCERISTRAFIKRQCIDRTNISVCRNPDELCSRHSRSRFCGQLAYKAACRRHCRRYRCGYRAFYFHIKTSCYGLFPASA